MPKLPKYLLIVYSPVGGPDIYYGCNSIEEVLSYAEDVSFGAFIYNSSRPIGPCDYDAIERLMQPKNRGNFLKFMAGEDAAWFIKDWRGLEVCRILS